VKTVLVVGYNAWDVIVPLPAAPPPDGKLETPGLLACGGGPAATAAVALARLGARARLVSPLADDPAGEAQRRELSAAGVDVSLCPARPGGVSPLAVSLVSPTGARSILWRRGELPAIDVAEVDPAWLDGVDCLLCDSHEPAAAARLAVAARARAVPVVLDGGNVRAGVAQLVPLCDDVISSTVFAPALTGRRAPAAALRALAALGPSRVAMTFGAAGCLASDGGAPFHVPAFDVPARDTTGAGDAFHAGYALARAEGRPLRACLDWGSAVAALKCRDWGGRRGLPGRDETEALLRQGARRRDPPPGTPVPAPDA